MERCMEHFSHSHSLILREIHHFKDLTPLEKYDHCHGCGERLLCKSFVYTCSNIRNIDDRSTIFDFCANFFLHKKCAHLPPSITTHDHEYSNHQKHDLFLDSTEKHDLFLETRVCCKVCCINIRYFYYYSPTTDFQVCLKCAIDLQGTSSKGPETIQHWSHQHTLLCVDRYATFHCDGCNKVSTDCSYKCDKCSFWIHQSCAELPKLYTFIHLHKHPLTLASSLPEVYSNFFQYCKICKIRLNERQWVYYCADCRFFAHIPCVVSTTPKLRGGLDDDDPELMHLPAADEASMNFMMQKRIKDILSESVDTAMAPPDHINHWAHPDHQLERKNKSDVLAAAAATCDHHHDNSQQLVSSEESLMICDGCTKPISFSSDDADVFYECNQCKYILHRYCAQFPKEIKTRDKKLVGRYERGEFGIDMFQCVNCFTSSNGFSFDIPQRYGYSFIDVPYSGLLDIWCACLPDKIKHRAHRHPLKQYLASRLPSYVRCAACCLPLRDPVNNTKVLYMCCDNFYLHVQCVVKDGTVLHRWDPHPLRLVLSLEDDDVENHPHEFECEFCCEEIDTNGWFYHCKVCDLSFHLHNCMDFNNNQYHYSNVKFGATNIRIEEAH